MVVDLLQQKGLPVVILVGTVRLGMKTIMSGQVEAV
jgi:hypothetical protein